MKKLAIALAAWGPGVVFLLAAIDSGGLPIPGGVDALLLLTSATNPDEAYMSALLATVGSLLGSFFLFWLARKGGEMYLATHVTSPATKRFQAWFAHYGMITIFVPMVLPIPLPAKIFVLSAGALGVSPWQFIGTMAAARIPRYFALAYLGASLGHNAGPWIKAHAWHIAGFALGLVLVLGLLLRFVNRPPEVAADAGQVS